MSKQDPYAVLGISPNATAEEIRKAYISRCKVLHPDRFDPKTQPKEWAQANEMHAELNRAYATLRNANQRSSSGAQPNGAETAQGGATSPPSTPDTPPAPHRPKRPFIDGRLIFMLFIAGFWELYMGATSLWRESGIDKVPHHLSMIELRDGSIPDNRSLKISDVECDLGHIIEYRENYSPRAYYIPLLTSSGSVKSEAPLPDRRIILRLTRELYETHSRALQNAGAPLTVEGIRLLNTDIESRIADFLKKELGIAKLDNVVIIDGGRQSIGIVLPLMISITYCVFLLGLFFTFVKKQKRVWAIVAIVCGWLALLPAIISREPRYKSPLPAQETNTTAVKYQTEQKAGASAHEKGAASDASGSQTSAATNNSAPSSIDPELAKLRKAAEQGDPSAQYRLGLNFLLGLMVPQDDVESTTWFRKAAKGGNADAEDLLGDEAYWSQKAKGPWGDYTISKENIFRAMQGDDEAIFMLEGIENSIKQFKIEGTWRGEGIDVNAKIYSQVICDLSGHGVRENAEEAVKWFRHRAERGNMMSQFQLGFIYEFARNNAEEAASWYRKSAEQGSPFAQTRLGELYRRGKGVLRDEIEALAWFNVAAAHSVNNPDGKKSFEMQTILWARDSQKADEQRLGQKISLLTQQRSKEILKKIEATRANHDQTSKFTKPDETNWAGTAQSGTGVFVTEDGLILTAAHVLEGAATIRIETSHGTKLGRLVKVDTQHDLALVKCEGKFQPVPVIAARDVKLGQAVFTIGFPNVVIQGVSPKMTRGEISSLAGLQDDPRQWQISVPVQPGNSGGPLFDEAGNVIGIIVAKLNAIKAAELTGDLSQNVNYAVKSAPALQLLTPYSEKLPRERQANPSDKVENVVEQCRESVVLILGYGP